MTAARHSHIEIDTEQEVLTYKGRVISFDLLDTLSVSQNVVTEFDPSLRTLTLKATIFNVDFGKGVVN